MKKQILSFALGGFTFLCVISCRQQVDVDPENKTKAGNFEIEFLFEHDGCKVYRFNDGRTVYFSDCTGKINYEYTTNHGKSSRKTHYVETLNN